MIDVAVIGCGIVGAAAALALSRYDLSVAVFEKENDVAMGTTKANSAILHAGYDPEPGTLMARLNAEGSRLGVELCKRLDVPMKQCGSLVAAFSEEELPALKTLYDRGVQNGVEGLQLLTGKEALALEPGLSQAVCGALYAPTAAVVNPWEYCLALTEAAVKNGAALYLEHGIEGIERLEEGFRLHTAGGEFVARYVINAAGVHADEIHNLAAPPAFTLYPERGEYYLLDKCEGGRVSHVVFQCPSKRGKGTLVAPTVHGNLIVGPNNEAPRDKDDVATTAEGLAEVRELALKSVPEINFRESIRNFSGNRAAADVPDFIIREALPGFLDLAGIKSPGLSAAPAIAEMAVGLLREGGLSLREKESVLLERRHVRFHELSAERQAALVRENPAYGRVICRCETVTEGEILDAMKGPVPPRSVEGVKRRCGAGLGRCQGGFCGPRVVELLSKAQGIPMDRVLLDGAGTWLLAGETKGGGAGV